jgi:patatin-related protein
MSVAPDANGQWEELRLALIMNGGVSLAVWMGGVSNEIFRLVTDQHPVYRALLEMTRTTARVDVISGTSAGGINGAAMATALMYGGDFSRLRDTWMDTGAFDQLLRSPLGENPGSLLKGDEHFLPELESALKALAPMPRLAPQGEQPIDLRLTATLLSGYQGRKVDDLGSPLYDVDYRAYFRFCHKQDHSDFDEGKTVIHRLARAARSTASFPFAFEPSLVTADDAGPHLTNYPLARNNECLAVPRYVVDGGVLDNKPFRGARDAIFAMPRSIGVRRVLAYINPDPGDGPPCDPTQRKGSRGEPTPPSLAKVLAAGIIGIPQSQTIADQLHEIEKHNETVRMRRDSVLVLAEAFKDDEADGRVLRDLAASLFIVYRRRRLATTFETFLFDPLSAAAARDPHLARPLATLGKQGRESLKLHFTQIDWKGWIPGAWPDAADDPANACGETWEWGLFPVEFEAKVMMDLLRMMQSLADYAIDLPQRQNPTEPTTWRPEAGAEASADWSDGNVAPGEVRMKHGTVWNVQSLLERQRKATQPNGGFQAEIAGWWQQACQIVERIATLRKEEQPEWNRRTTAALQQLADAVDLQGCGSDVLLAWMRGAIPEMFAFVSEPGRRALCARLACDIAVLMREASLLARELVNEARARGRLRPLQLATARGLDDLANVLSRGNDAHDTLFTLLQMEVAEFAFNDHDALSSDTLIELVQISGNSKSPLGKHEVAKKKLLGLQLAHFGAFYKRSWRANDWAFGRLDGSERLVKILLSPERLQRFYYLDSDGAAAAIRRIAVDAVESSVLRNELDRQWRERGLTDRIRDELAFLEAANHDLPSALPTCSEAITLRLHYGILREELEVLGAAVTQDVNEGADARGVGNALVQNLRNPQGQAAAPFSPAQAAARLAEGLIAREDFRQEAGSDLFTRTLAHTLATAQGTLAAKATNLGPVSVFFASLRLPMLGFHYVAQGLTHQTRTAAALHGGMLGIGLALVLLQYLWTSSTGETALPKGVLTFGWALLAIGLMLAIVRVPWLMTAALALAAASMLWFGQPEIKLVALLLTLTAVSLSFPALQVAVGLTIVLLAALQAAGWKLETWENIPWHAPALHFGALICLALLIATLQASGLLARADRAIRRTSRPPPPTDGTAIRPDSKSEP